MTTTRFGLRGRLGLDGSTLSQKLTKPSTRVEVVGEVDSSDGEAESLEAAAPQRGTRDAILDSAQTFFSRHGYDGTSLNDIANDVGIKRPSLLHHFESKEALYSAIFERRFADWFQRIENATQSTDPNTRAERNEWETMDRILEAGFSFFSANPEFVRIVRWEMLAERGNIAIGIGEALRPLMVRASAFFQRGIDSGTFRSHDPEQLLLTGYGAILSSFSDVVFLEALTQRDPLGEQSMHRRYEHLRSFFRSALQPVLSPTSGASTVDGQHGNPV